MRKNRAQTADIMSQTEDILSHSGAFGAKIRACANQAEVT